MASRTMIITESLSQQKVDQIQQYIPDWNIVVGKETEIWKPYVKEAEIIAGWNRRIEQEVLSQDSNLRWIQSWSAGVNSFPLEQLKVREILLTTASGVHAYPISETIFAMMLGFTRNIHTYVRNQLKKQWDDTNLKLEIHDKTIGIIGVGEIGLETAKIAKAFGMKVIGVRNSGKQAKFVDEMYKTEQLPTVLKQCDFVIVCLPLTKKTHHLFGKEQFKQMKSTAFFVNIGRGEIVDENALISALRNGKIAGAGLDVFEKEPLQEDSPLWDLENVIITPHTAGSTAQYDQRVIENILIPNLKNYLSGNDLTINLVDYHKGY